eukprot:CAMPEP_0201477936 /NCGR_PEP_ID=MMETSP0151_2-20130828/2871_1 /ASSEMBLY_ACC=CAM_ASM_000257 /TAXON_ID=200890 /ORGANISM="Paramoeba atlantica, Strain 621/1 / CCAP 1560/9" /LENGTH=63 /DNA_ID=CAMNT_0047858823 /DNA_START=419 /DNA_END=608 /DNA_ORIENTATION=-
MDTKIPPIKTPKLFPLNSIIPPTERAGLKEEEEREEGEGDNEDEDKEVEKEKKEKKEKKLINK